MQLSHSIKALISVAGIISASPALADITYTYTSSSLNSGTGPSAFSEPFVISLTFSEEGCLVNWSAVQPAIGTLSSTNPMPVNNAYRPIIYLTTSESGQPTKWFFNAYTEYPGAIYWKQQIASIKEISWLGEPLPDYFYDSVGWDSSPPDVQSLGAGFSYTIGTWTATRALPRLVFRYDPNYDNLCPPVSIPDSDGDGVLDDLDQCPNTPAGTLVDGHGCSIEQLVPCAGPLSGGRWRNHGQYVRAVVKATGEFREAGLLTRKQRLEIFLRAVKSSCGDRNIWKPKPGATLGIKQVDG